MKKDSATNAGEDNRDAESEKPNLEKKSFFGFSRFGYKFKFSRFVFKRDDRDVARPDNIVDTVGAADDDNDDKYMGQYEQPRFFISGENRTLSSESDREFAGLAGLVKKLRKFAQGKGIGLDD